MPCVLIAGIGQRFYGSFQGFRPFVPDWTVAPLIVSRRKNNDFASCCSELETALQRRQKDADGTHVVAFHSKRTDKDALREKIGYCVRFLWSDEEHAESFGTAAFNDRLAEILQVENVWREQVRPRDVRSPLMLPQNRFLVGVGFNEMWPRADRARDAGEIERVRGLVDRFRGEYYKRHQDSKYDGAAYISPDDLAFKFPHPDEYHGTRTPWKHCHKYTFLIPPGFHYDVGHRDERRFNIEGDGGPVPVAKYINVDPYGSLREGK